MDEYAGKEHEEKLVDIEEKEKELEAKALAASKKDSNRSSKKKLTVKQKGALLTSKYKGRVWQDSSGDEAEYVIDEIKPLRPNARSVNNQTKT
jgi:co-chaperonin GroES (HSP10)